MKIRIITFIFATIALAAPAFTQSAQLFTPSPVEKELAARASNVDEITLDKHMLSFASQFMAHKESSNPLANRINPNAQQDEDATRKLIDGLDGIYVRDYEFDKEGRLPPNRPSNCAPTTRPANGRRLCAIGIARPASPAKS